MQPNCNPIPRRFDNKIDVDSSKLLQDDITKASFQEFQHGIGWCSTTDTTTSSVECEAVKIAVDKRFADNQVLPLRET